MSRVSDPSVEIEVFPKWMFGPNEEQKLCHSPADVPGGWVSHPSLLPKEGDVADKTEEIPLTRAQVIEELKERKLPFKQTASTKTLYDALIKAVEESGEA